MQGTNPNTNPNPPHAMDAAMAAGMAGSSAAAAGGGAGMPMPPGPVDNDLYSWMFMNSDLFAATNGQGVDPMVDASHGPNSHFKSRRSSISARGVHGALESPLGTPASAAALAAASYNFPGSMNMNGARAGGSSMEGVPDPVIRRRQSLESGDMSADSVSDSR
jgi:hypothetical protein